MVNRRVFCAAALAGLWLGSAHAGEGLTVRGAWIPEAPPTARVQAAYLDLVNEGPAAAVVEGAQSPDFARIEMHGTIQSQGTARMEAQPDLRVDGGATLVLAPGGLHLMLIEPRRRLVAGDRVDIELRVRDGSPIRALAEVRSTAAPSAAHDHHHH